MKNTTHFFHLVSYVQYPLLIGSLYFYFPFLLSILKNEPDWSSLNNVLILLGTGLSFSTLQDTKKTQNNLSRKIWEDPKKGKIALGIITFLAFSFVLGGLITLFTARNEALLNIAIGVIALGIGMVGMLKSAIEMFENHRKDSVD